MNTLTANTTLKFGFYNAKPLLAAYENDIVYVDMPQFPDDAEYRELLSQMRQSPEATKRIETVVDKAAALAKDDENVLKNASVDARTSAAAAMYMLHIDIAIEKSTSPAEYVVAAHVLKRLRSHLGRTLFNAQGRDVLRTLLLDNMRETANLAAQQQEFLM